MEREDVFNKVAQAVSETMSKEVDELSEETTFDSLGADSLDLIELISTMEDTFDTTIADEELEQIHTLGDAVDAILRALAA